MGNLPIGLGIGLAIMTALMLNAERRLGNAQETIGTLTEQVNTVTDANQSIRGTLASCQAINKKNAAQFKAVIQLAAKATTRIRILKNELEKISKIEFTPTDTECRRLDEPLPGDFLSWLCVAGAQNCLSD